MGRDRGAQPEHRLPEHEGRQHEVDAAGRAGRAARARPSLPKASGDRREEQRTGQVGGAAADDGGLQPDRARVRRTPRHVEEQEGGHDQVGREEQPLAGRRERRSRRAASPEVSIAEPAAHRHMPTARVAARCAGWDRPRPPPARHRTTATKKSPRITSRTSWRRLADVGDLTAAAATRPRAKTDQTTPPSTRVRRRRGRRRADGPPPPVSLPEQPGRRRRGRRAEPGVLFPRASSARRGPNLSAE